MWKRRENSGARERNTTFILPHLPFLLQVHSDFMLHSSMTLPPTFSVLTYTADIGSTHLKVWRTGARCWPITLDARKQLASSVCRKVSRDVEMCPRVGEGRGVRPGQGNWEARVGSKFPLFYRRFHLFPRKYC